MPSQLDDITTKLSTLSPGQRARLKAILSREKVHDISTGTNSRAISRDANGGLPLSFAQQRLWFLDQLQPGDPFYNMPAAFRIKGALAPDVLERCLAEIVRRHEVLRTTYTTHDNRPVQIIHAVGDFSLSVIDLTPVPASAREAEALRLAQTEATKAFYLSRGPVFRARLVKLADDNHLLVINLHHIASDNLSKVILYRELGALYEAYSVGRQSPLDELPIQYADCAIWQHERLQGALLDEQLAYWKATLQSAPPLLELPTDRPRPQFQTYRGAYQTRTLPKSLLDGLKALSEANGATLFMTLLAVFKLLLARYTRSEDIVVATPVAGRNRLETESLIGFFANTLVLRTDCSNDPCFTEFLARVRTTCLEAYAHQDMPFEKLVEELRPERSLSYAPLVQVMFGQRYAAARKLSLDNLDVTLVELANESAIFDLYIGATETADGLHLSVEYNTDLFDEATIIRLLGHYETLLKGIVRKPDQKLSKYPLLTAAECHQILVDWNNTATDYPDDCCIHQLFEAQVDKTPDAIAVVFEDQQLSYTELNTQANQLAHHLISLGVGPEVLVALCVERSLEMIISLLGILKAGGVYVPLDPGYPKERLAFMLEDTNAPVLITQSHLEETLSERHTQCVFIDQAEVRDRYPITNPNAAVTPGNLAYVIYTSGSTGQPKGAMNTHCGIVNRLLWMQDIYRLDGADRVLQKTPFSFDVSVWEFFWPLLNGARLIVARPGGHQDSAYLAKTIIEHGINTLHFVPSMLQVFLAEHGVENCRSLKHVICSGEALSFDLQQRFFERMPLLKLHNLYGPTEAAVDVTFWPCDPVSKYPIVPIGRPIANTQIYILDANLNPVPIGISGELHIGGVGLARGYLNRSELTAEKFISNPFSEDPNARLYKTSDLVRYLPDGNIEFLGRIDHQIKIRGFRIELGEIEAVLSRHPNVSEAVVIAREDQGDKRLIAYLVAEGMQPSVSELRSFLQQKLPDYMLPSAYVTLDQLPLSPNGKLDRNALPAPDQTHVQHEAFIEPKAESEKIVARIFAEVLKLDRVGIHDNFFDLGGHSLLATQVISRVRQTFHVELPLRVVFETPTVAGLALAILQSHLEDVEPDVLESLLMALEENPEQM